MSTDQESNNASKAGERVSRSSLHPTACLNCRQARQKCDRQQPCLRCTCHGLHCDYPARSNRGRKRGSTNKPDTVEKLLSRINDSSVRDDVIAAIVQRHKGSDSPNDLNATLGALQDSRLERSDSERDDGEHDYSPLQILAAAVVAEKDQGRKFSTLQRSSNQPDGDSASMDPAFNIPDKRTAVVIDGELSKYFAPRLKDRTDWQVLESQSGSCRMKLDTATRNPLAAGIINQNDESTYFNLFFTLRNPMIGLLDPVLHTPRFVRTQSFTLYSVICALGSALSSLPRDKLLHPTLFGLAEENVQWSIATSVKSIETVQAIIYLTYWNSTHDRLADDPYWLRISHATQLARELGIHRPASNAQRVNALNLQSTTEKERVLRNYQRTWLYVFVVDKSFGMTTGREISVSCSDVPANIGEWWQRPSAAVLDRLIVNCVDHRVLMVKAFEKRQRLSRSRENIVNWQNETFATISNLRADRCAPDGSVSSTFLPIFAFYLDHGLLAINAHSSRDLISVDKNEGSTELAIMSQQTMDVAMRFIDNIISDELMVRLMLGLHNTQLIMISHAANEVLHAIKRSLSAEDALRAGNKIRLLANHIENIAAALPPTSWASLYLRLFRFFVAQLEEVTAVGEEHVLADVPNNPFMDWWKFTDIDSLELVSSGGMDFVTSDPQLVDMGWDPSTW